MRSALTSNVKINGIARKAATNSTVDLLLAGTAGTTITNGSVKDSNNVIWNLPVTVSIGVDGTLTVTATCANSGAVAALAGTITTINTPTRGWTSVTNPTAPQLVNLRKTTRNCVSGRGRVSHFHPSLRLKLSTVQLPMLLA